MSAQANIVINDGATTPVAHTFNPKGARTSPEGKDIAVWRDQTPANADVYYVITEQHAPPNGNRLEKFRWVIEIPTPESVGTNDAGITPPIRKAYSVTGVIEVWLPSRATEQECKHIAAYVKNFAATSYFTDAIAKREAAW